jgi:Flp pilus assembly pilin Flp
VSSTRWLRFVTDEEGSTLLEYLMIATIVVLIILVGITVLGDATETMFQDMSVTVAAAGT